jgi:ABC-type transporter Mla maintaining outer membrane lipid asymmetry permease subunit MlaE
VSAISGLGHGVNDALLRLGFATRFFFMLLYWSGQSFRRLSLTIREIYFSGFQSLLIIMVSGLFIGMVLGMQGYETLQRYGSPTRSAFWSPCRWCASLARWSPPCFSPRARVRRSPPKSA